MNDIEIIKEIQRVQLQSLKKLDDICKKHDIQYFMFWGSLLGTVRHNGFIPWDDDLDIGMMREDYEKLTLVPKEEWGEEYSLVMPEEDLKMHDKISPRIYINKSIIQSPRDIYQWKSMDSGQSFYTSLMLDIYIFDNAPVKKIKFWVNYHYISLLGKLYKPTKWKAVTEKTNLSSKLKVRLKNAYANYLRSKYSRPWACLAKSASNIGYSSGQTGKICCYYHGKDATFENADVYFPLKLLPFEDMQVPVPNNYDFLLRKCYGDYMKYPPETERFHIDFNYVDLGNGKVFITKDIAGSIGYREKID